MVEAADFAQRFRGIAFVGNYLPRRCGIATFTYDLAEAVAEQAGTDQPVIVTAINDRHEGYSYPERVKFEVRQDYQIDYSRAADYLNFSRIDVVSLQHEYGIFGGEWGSNVLTLMRDLRRPLVVTCHTVYKEPDPFQKDVFVEIASRADKLVVMSELAFQFLEDIYGVKRSKIAHIPHGIHDVPFIDPSYYKDKYGMEGRRLLITFGLLHRNKGIEYMIEALPPVVERYPRTTYLVLGATHPVVLRDEGEAYRLSLQRRVMELGLEEHVLFHPRFVDLDELLEYLGASDIFIAPYLNLDQITSGALAYAMGSGKAVVSTPFWHAEEMLARGRGRIVPVRDSNALTREILGLLDDEVTLNTVRKRAYTFCRSMVWSATARAYIDLFDEVRSHVPRVVPTASAVRRPLAATNVPLPKLDHLIRLSDDTGPSHHARHTVPDWSYGYRLEDAAATLVAAAKYFDLLADAQAARLAETCLALLQILIGEGKSITEGLDYARRPLDRAPEAVIGQGVWGLGYAVDHGPSLLSEAASDLFHQLLPKADLEDFRGAGYATLGAANFLIRFPGATEVKRYLRKHAERVASQSSGPGWIERWPSHDWPVAAQSMIVAASMLKDDKMRQHARSLIDEMREATSEGRVFLRRGENPDEEELPTSAAAFIEALGAEFHLSRDKELLKPIRAATDWFLGANRIGMPLYDFSTGGCHDALTASGLNRNQGTQTTVFCLLAFLTLHRIASIVDSAAAREASPS